MAVITNLHESTATAGAVATLLYEHRQRSGRTIRSITAPLHISVPYYSQIENARRHAPPAMLRRLAAELGIDMAEMGRAFVKDFEMQAIRKWEGNDGNGCVQLAE